MMNKYIFLMLLGLTGLSLPAETGYELWLRYQPIEDNQLRTRYSDEIKSLVVGGDNETFDVIREEVTSAVSQMLGKELQQTSSISEGSVVIARPGQLGVSEDLASQGVLDEIGAEGYLIKKAEIDGKQVILITANSDAGLLYGSFHFLRHLQTHQKLDDLYIKEQPAVDLRVLNHWDNLDRTSERGYAGFSIWDWHRLPGYIDPRYIDYARANASIGINGTVLTNVNANAMVLTPMYLEKVKALADIFRPYNIKVYLTARFSAPIEIGGLETADPLNEEVRQWWQDKADEIYEIIPDFGGFLVKANSEGQPGPQNYGRTHADGANMLAEALKPHEGVVMWRAFVYSDEEPDDRAKQAYNEFKPLDDEFMDNVLIQVKNGPIDFQPREPFHPLFGAMPQTPLMMEFQITQEYLGQATQLVYLAPMFEETLKADTYAKGEGSTVADVVEGSLHDYSITGMAGVANTGTDINWTGHLFGQANWYAYGRLTWEPDLSSEEIASEWIQMTFDNDEKVEPVIEEIMMRSREAAVNYMTPLGLQHQMGWSHHYGPAPWITDKHRADWTSAYYHRADEEGIGFDRTTEGSDAVSQYFPEVAEKFNDKEEIPQEFLLWFHHVDWDYEMPSGRNLWEELAWHYQTGVDTVKWMKDQWASLEGLVDEERHNHVSMLLDIQLEEARWWKNASLLYFQQFSDRPLPDFVEKPEKDLEYYKSLEFPFAPGIRPKW